MNAPLSRDEFQTLAECHYGVGDGERADTASFAMLVQLAMHVYGQYVEIDRPDIERAETFEPQTMGGIPNSVALIVGLVENLQMELSEFMAPWDIDPWGRWLDGMALGEVLAQVADRKSEWAAKRAIINRITPRLADHDGWEDLDEHYCDAAVAAEAVFAFVLDGEMTPSLLELLSYIEEVTAPDDDEEDTELDDLSSHELQILGYLRGGHKSTAHEINQFFGLLPGEAKWALANLEQRGLAKREAGVWSRVRLASDTNNDDGNEQEEN